MNKLSDYISVINKKSVEGLEIVNSESRNRKNTRPYETHYFTDYKFNNGVVIQYEYYKDNPIDPDWGKVNYCIYRVTNANGLEFDSKGRKYTLSF